MSDGVILVGASVRSLAEVSVRRGLRPRCFDLFCDADLQTLLTECGGTKPVQIRSCTEIPSRVKDIDETIPLVWCGGLENHPHLLTHLTIRRRVCGTSPSCLSAVTPEKLARLTAGTGMRIPEGRFSRSGRLFRRSGDRWLVKPVAGCGGSGIRDARSGDHPTADVFLQKHVSGTPISALFYAPAASGAVRLLTASRQLVGLSSLGGSPFAFCGNRGPICLPTPVRTALEAVACRAAAAGLQGVFGMDCIVRGSDVWLIEINPRITASHEQYDLLQTATSTIDLQIQRQGVRAPVLPEEAAGCLTRLILYARRSFVLTEGDVDRLLTFRRSPNHTGIAAGGRTGWLADIPRPGRIAAGQPFCSIYVVDSPGGGFSPAGAFRDLSELLRVAAAYTGLRAEQVQSVIDSSADPFSD